MGYWAEKQKVERKVGLIKRILLCIAAALVIGLCVLSAFVPAEAWKYEVNTPDVAKRGEGELRIHFLDVGQGDCTLLEFPDGKTMLIDGGNGEESTAETILRYLNALDIDSLDYLLATHADADHCGALDRILEYKKVSVAYLPVTSPAAEGEYADFYAALLKTECERTYSSRKIVLSSSSEAYPYLFSFLYPYTKDVESAQEDSDAAAAGNETSAVAWLDYHGVSALFTGDAPAETEELLVRDDKLGFFRERGVDLTSTEILKVSHHGSGSATGAEFLEYLNVQTAVISCGKENAYGHPSQETLDRLAEADAATYRTDTDGHVIVTVFADGSYKTEKLAT